PRRRRRFAAAERKLRHRDVLERAGGGGWLWQRARERPPTLHPRLAPDQFLHRLRGRHPGPAALAPSRRTGNRHLPPELVGEGRGVAEGILPLRGHENEALLHDLRRIQGGIEVLEAGDAD